MQALVDDIIDSCAIGGLASGAVSALLAGREVVWVQGLSAGLISYGAFLATYYSTIYVVDTYATDFFLQWSDIIGLVAAVSADYLVALLFSVSFEVLLVANVVGACSYYFFSEKMYS